MVLAVCKFLGIVDAVMDETAYVQLVITAQVIRVNNTVRHDFLFDSRHQRIRLGIIYDNGIDPSVAFQNAEDNHFSYRAEIASTFTPSAEIALIQFDGTVKDFIGSQGKIMADDHADFAVEQDCRIGMDTQNIGSRTGGNLEYKKRSSSFCNFFFNLQCVIFIFQG